MHLKYMIVLLSHQTEIGHFDDDHVARCSSFNFCMKKTWAFTCRSLHGHNIADLKIFFVLLPKTCHKILLGRHFDLSKLMFIFNEGVVLLKQDAAFI